MKRRTFLELLMAGCVAGRPALSQETDPPQPQRVLVTIAGIGAGTDVVTLGSVLAALVVGGVPVNLVVEGGTAGPDGIGQAAGGVSAASGIGQLVLRYARSFPGLVEIVAWCPDLGSAAPFQAARKAQVARQALSDALFPAPDGGAPPGALLTVACRAPLVSTAASATLAAGFRCVLALPPLPTDIRPAPGAKVEARLDRQGLLSILGGETVRLEEAAAQVARPHPGMVRHLLVQAADLSRSPADALTAGAQALVRALQEGALELRLVAVLASDVQMRSEVAFRHRVALHLQVPPARGPGGEAAAALRRELAAAGIPFSHGPPVPDTPTGPALWVPLDLAKGTPTDTDLRFAAFAGEELASPAPGLQATEDPRFGIALRPVRDAGHAGLTAAGVYHVPSLATLDAAGSLALTPEVRGDGVVLVDAAAFGTPARRAALLLAIRRDLMQPSVRLVSLPEFCAETLPKDPLLPSLLLTRAAVHRKARPPAVPGTDAQEALREDARAAWAYFEASTHRTTGLCPATTVMGSRPVASHVAVTMWEAGSHLNALIAAVDLGLIPDDEFTARSTRLLRSVERASRKRLALPPETIDTLTGRGTTRFNSFDTARLMIALHRLQQHRLAPKGLAGLVASWDFGRVILDRRLHSYRERRLIDDFASNYADYAAAGMRLWGFDVASPMDGIAGLATVDDEAALLATTVSFGLLGAEPSLLHLVEMATAPVPSFLADCLDALWTRMAHQTGTPAAYSESPLDQAPWFTYQGLDLRNLADPWSLSGSATAPDGAAGREDLRATSTKAAYLWHALRPNAQSARLLATARATARGAFGFDSAIYVGTGRSTKGYSDLNTNAMILQAVAHMLTASG
jgi:hypothetical protein